MAFVVSAAGRAVGAGAGGWQWAGGEISKRLGHGEMLGSGNLGLVHGGRGRGSTQGWRMGGPG